MSHNYYVLSGEYIWEIWFSTNLSIIFSSILAVLKARRKKEEGRGKKEEGVNIEKKGKMIESKMNWSSFF
ncbi:hypothetical protein AFK68_28305 [Hydrocoleum sp. CS-953]|nr:hypothetical protein AFK68_28305 [Hydrocoleum sp. CS-953]